MAGGHKANFYMNKEAIEFKKNIKSKAQEQFMGEPSSSNIYAFVDFSYKHNYGKDIDNGLKLLFDALQGVVYVDDNQIVEMKVRKREGRDKDRIKVTIFNEKELKLL